MRFLCDATLSPPPPGQRVVGRHMQLVAEQQGELGRPWGPGVEAEKNESHEHARRVYSAMGRSTGKNASLKKKKTFRGRYWGYIALFAPKRFTDHQADNRFPRDDLDRSGKIDH